MDGSTITDSGRHRGIATRRQAARTSARAAARTVTASRSHLDMDDGIAAGHFARLNTNSSVTPAGVRGFVSFNSSSVIDVTIRR
jgi:hypothetical protein